MLRVLHSLYSMDRGGAETFVMNIYRNIDRSKVQFDFLLHSDKNCAYNDEIRALGGRIFVVPPRNKGILKNIMKLKEFFETHREYKILHQHVSSLSYIEPLRIAKHYKVPVRIVHGHSTQEGGTFLHKYLHYLNQLSIKSYATDYFACSDLAAKWLYGSKQYNDGKYIIINNGINVEKFVFREKIRLEKRDDLGIKKEAFVLGHIGRFSFEKNHEFLIDIFNEVYKKDCNFVLLLVGDGELRGKIEQKVNALGLQNNVIFTGIRSDIPDILQVMDIFVMPSYYEGLPVSIVEAQAIGLPCVVSSNITKQIKITDFIQFIGLNEPVSIWANTIINIAKSHIRKDSSQDIIDAGFDIKNIARYLQDKYISLAESI